MKIIPAIDIIDGKCVRLSKGDYNTKKIYNENPLEVAKLFEDNGIRYLHLVDLDGAKNKRITNLNILEKLASQTGLSIDFGGGIQSKQDIKDILNAGAYQVTIGSIAMNEPSLFLDWLHDFGSDTIILGADCENRKIAVNGWLNTSETDIISFIAQHQKNGIKQVMVTDIAKDGMLSGPSFALYEEILQQTTIELITSGGITSVNDVIQLRKMGCQGAIIGKALYEGTITLKDLQC